MKDSRPIFADVFGDDWHDLPPVLHLHYANRPFSSDIYVAEGTMSVTTSPALRLFAPILRFLGGIPAVNARDVPVTVKFKSELQGNSLHFVRHFHLNGKTPYIFHSRMVTHGGPDVTEVMKFRLGWRVRFFWQDSKVMLCHNGFCLFLFGRFIPLPLTWLIGHIHAEEEATSDNSFAMFVEICHPFFGKIYDYRGHFHMVPADG